MLSFDSSFWLSYSRGFLKGKCLYFHAFSMFVYCSLVLGLQIPKLRRYVLTSKKNTQLSTFLVLVFGALGDILRKSKKCRGFFDPLGAPRSVGGVLLLGM